MVDSGKLTNVGKDVLEHEVHRPVVNSLDEAILEGRIDGCAPSDERFHGGDGNHFRNAISCAPSSSEF